MQHGRCEARAGPGPRFGAAYRHGQPPLHPILGRVGLDCPPYRYRAHGWVELMFALYYVEAVTPETTTAGKVGYWIVMAAGDLALVLVAMAVVWFITMSIRRARLLKRQDAFIDRVTHELKTPIAGIRLALDTIRRRQLPAQRVEELHDGMRGNLDRLQDLIDHVIEAGRLEDGSRDVRRVELSPAAVVEHCVERVCQRHDCPVERFRLDLEAAPDEAVSDPVALESIVVNLLDNAIKYGRGETVTVSLLEGVDVWSLSVADRGIGLPMGEESRIFRRFHRVEHIESKRQPGSGLGLYIVSWLVGQLGGSVEARSAGLGTGTTVTVELPSRPDGA